MRSFRMLYTHLVRLGPRTRRKRALGDDELALFNERLLVEGIFAVHLALGKNREARINHVGALDNGHCAGAHPGASDRATARTWSSRRARALGHGAGAK